MQIKLKIKLNVMRNIKQKKYKNVVRTMATILKYPDKAKLIEMLQLEENIRMSQDYISMCDEVKDEINGWLRISSEIQYEIAKKFGYTSQLEQDIAVNLMRGAQNIYPDEPLFKTIPVYVRNDIARKGEFEVNSIVPNIQIHKLDDMTVINLLDTFSNTKPNLLLCSSHT